MQKEKRETKIQDFEVEYKLGEGAYGYVFLASRNGQEYAIKELSKQQLKKCDSEHQPLVEKQVLRLAKHPGIVKSHFAFQSNSKLYLALEVCQTRLDDLVRQHLLSEQAKRFLVAELVDVLDYLRRNGIVHRDLKPSNLMLSNGHLKLIDFGTASLDKCSLVSDIFKDRLAAFRGKGHNKQNQQTQVTKWQTEEAKSGVQRMHRRKSSFVGTSQYISPQLLELNECEFAADLWALGCVVYFLYYGESPFRGVCELQVYHKIKQAEVVFPENAQLSGEARDLMMKLLVKDPEQRLGSCSRQDLSFAALKRHPYFANLDFHHLFTTLPPYLHQTLLSHNQPSSFKGNSLQKTLIKHTEDRGDVVCQVRYKSGSILEQTEVGGDSHSHRSYKLQLDIQNKLAHQLGERRFSLGVQNSQRLIYTSQDAASICQFFNSVAQADRQ